MLTDVKPKRAIEREEDERGCFTPLLVAASKGSTIAFSEKTVGCMGAKTGLGFGRYELGRIEYFLSTGDAAGDGEHYKKTPKHARESIKALPEVRVNSKYVVFKPLDNLDKGEVPKTVIFLVNADQLSGLVTLASYDRRSRQNVVLNFGAGCHSVVLFALAEAETDDPKPVIGMTDPSARKHLDAGTLSFSVPYKRFLEMEEQVEESFLKTETWAEIARRI